MQISAINSSLLCNPAKRAVSFGKANAAENDTGCDCPKYRQDSFERKAPNDESNAAIIYTYENGVLKKYLDISEL